jgi:hypothetical protein
MATSQSQLITQPNHLRGFGPRLSGGKRMLALGVPGDATRRSEYPHPFLQKEKP